MTITQYMAEQKLEGGVSLDDSDDGSSASKVLTSEQGRKYKLGKMVAQGGMGAVLEAKDANIRRHVAMKVLLDPAQAGKDDVLRFIEEAQVTGDSNIPPSCPSTSWASMPSGNVFYTMKFLHGVTLKAVLKDIAASGSAGASPSQKRKKKRRGAPSPEEVVAMARAKRKALREGTDAASTEEDAAEARRAPGGDGERRASAASANLMPHLPAGRVPDSLAAVAMKALALKRSDRYQSVRELQADIGAYQNGFATSASGNRACASCRHERRLRLSTGSSSPASTRPYLAKADLPDYDTEPVMMYANG